jgi:DNA-binding NtrC family response regulator
MTALKCYSWPGNVRELENALQRLVIMTDGDTITLKDLPADMSQSSPRKSGNGFHLPSSGIHLDKEMEAVERRWLQEALAHSKQNKVEASRLLGVDRNRLNYLCRKYNL